MKIADVKIGMKCLTMVSGQLAQVEVNARIEPDGRWHKQARFRVSRADNNKPLDKPRTAAALRPLPAPPVAKVLYCSDPSRDATGLEVIVPETTDLKMAAEGFRRVKEEIQAGSRAGYVRLLINGQPRWRFPKVVLGGEPSGPETAK